MRKLSSLALFLFVILQFSCFGQIVSPLADQMPPVLDANHNFIQTHSLNETVNPATGALSINISVPIPSGRNLTSGFAIQYNSNSAHHGWAWTGNMGYMGAGGWSYVVPTLSFTMGQLSNYVNGTIEGCPYYTNYLFTDIKGVVHPLGLILLPTESNCPGVNHPGMTQVLTGGDATVLANTVAMISSNAPPPVTITDADGTVYYFNNERTHQQPGDHALPQNSYYSPLPLMTVPTWVEDRNGSQITFSDSGNGQVSLTDTLQRTALNIGGFGVGTTSLAVPGLNAYQVTWVNQPFFSNWNIEGIAPQSYMQADPPVYCFSGNGVANNTVLTDSPGVVSTQPVISQIVLPNNQTYTFLYDFNPNTHTGTGLLSQITYPDGAVVNYTWTTNHLSDEEVINGGGNGVYPCEIMHDTPALQSKVVMFAGSTPALEEDYSYTPTTWGSSGVAPYQVWTAKQTVVTTKDRIRGTSYLTKYNYVPTGAPSNAGPDPYAGLTAVGPVNPTESSILYYADLGQTLLKTVTKSYWDYWALPSDVKTTLDNGQTSEVQSCFAGLARYPSGSLCTPTPEPLYLSAALLTDLYEFDYGTATNDASIPGPIGPLQRHTHADYASFTTPLYPSLPSIVDRVQGVKIYDGNGYEVAESDYCYDNSAAPFAECKSGTPIAAIFASQHDEAHFGAASTAQRGNVTTKISRCFSGTAGTACAQGDSVSQYAWFETGQMASKTDANGNTTSYSYLDSFDVNPASNTNAYLTKITYPSTNGVSHKESFQYAFVDGALILTTGENSEQTSYHYNDPLRRIRETDAPDTSYTKVAYNDTPYPPNIVTNKQLYNQPDVISTVTTDGLGHVYKAQLNSDSSETDTVLDGLARAYTVTNPFRSSSDSTYGITTTKYDALGRVTTLTRQDGGVVTTSYSGPMTTVTDETGNQRRAISDALGRLIQVNEPGDPQPATTATGTLNITGNSLKSFTTAATPATAMISILSANPCRQFQVGAQGSQTVCDQGTVWVTINGGNTISASYITSNSSPNLNAIATSLANAINSDNIAKTIVFASVGVGSNTITLTALTAGASCCNYAMTAGSTSTQGVPGAPVYFNPPGISATASSALGGGTNSVTTYDYGTLTATIGSWTSVAVPYGQNGSNGGNNTAALVLSALENSPGAAAAPVSVTSVSGASVSFRYNTAGSAGNVAVSINSTSSNPGAFGSGSFGGSTVMTGGWDGGPTLAVPFVTLYQYDALGNLLCVEQHGDSPSGLHSDGTAGTGCSAGAANDTNSTWRVRRFTYNSLSQLLTAYNPETGNIGYTYDPNGNVTTKTDARGVSTIYSRPNDSPIDALNRVTKITFSNGDPAVTFTYDQGMYGIGRRTAMIDASGSTGWTYDKMGHVVTEQRTIYPGTGFNPVTKTVSYQWNLGSLTGITYPDGTQINYTLDSVGRTLTETDSTHSINYIAAATYAPTGGLSGFTEQAGNSITNSFVYNPRLQICRELSSTTGAVPQSCADGTQTGNVMDFQYDFHLGNHNNGNLYTAANNRDPSRTQRYTYDALNRLLSAVTQGTLDSSGHIDCSVMVPGSGTQTKYWGESFTYDPWANLTGKGTTLCSAETAALGTTALNQLGADTYDTAGNVISSGGTTFSYNGESELTATSNGYSYVYDGDGNRVEKSNGTSGTLYWYAGPGILLETDLTGSPQSEYLFFGGQRLARRDISGMTSPVYYYFGNQIHSTALITDASGNIQDDADYYPWGGTLQLTSTPGFTNHYWFTGKERDSETGLDYFGARYYGNSMGRFLTPDWSAKAEGVPFADFHDPQSLNLYGYVRNHPTYTIDKNGHIGGADDAAEALELGAIGGGLLVYYYVALPQNQRTLQRAWDLTTDTLANALNNALHRNNNQAPSPATNGQTGAQSTNQNTSEQGRDKQGKFLPTKPGQAAPGADSEKKGLASVGAVKNNETINGTKRDGTIPATGQHVEVKSGGTVSNTEQLKSMGQTAVDQTGQPLKVVTTNPNVQVSQPAQENKNLQIEPMKPQ